MHYISKEKTLNIHFVNGAKLTWFFSKITLIKSVHIKVRKMLQTHNESLIKSPFYTVSRSRSHKYQLNASCMFTQYSTVTMMLQLDWQPQELDQNSTASSTCLPVNCRFTGSLQTINITPSTTDKSLFTHTLRSLLTLFTISYLIKWLVVHVLTF